MITVEIDKKDQRELERQFKRLIAVTKEPVEDILAQQGRLFALAAAKYTGRFGDVAKTGARHKKDVESSIKSTYAPASGKKGTAGLLRTSDRKRWNKAVRNRDIGKLQQLSEWMNLSKTYGGKRIKVIMWDRGAAHTRRVKGKGQSNTIHLVVDYGKNVSAYIQRKKKNVGEAKAGWAKAAKMLGHKGSGKGMPAYFAKGHKTRGYGSVKGTGSNAVMTVAHYGKYGFSKTNMGQLWRHRATRIGKQIEKIINSKSKKIVK